jgi:hypothetical protein
MEKGKEKKSEKNIMMPRRLYLVPCSLLIAVMHTLQVYD